MNELKNNLVEQNLGLVHLCAKKFKGRGVEYEDLYQAGCLGLVKASKSFDPSKGFAFSTYAVYVILGEIKKIFRDGGSVKIGRTFKDKARNAIKAKNELTVTLGREPTVNELSELIGEEPAETAAMLNISAPVISIYSEEYEFSTEKAYSDFPEKELSDNIALEQVLKTLDGDDRKIIEMRYFRGMTQSETAKQFGMTQVQVSRKEKKILEFIRNKMS